MDITADTTLRQVNAYSIDVLATLIASIDQMREEAAAFALEQDYHTAQVVAQSLSSLSGTRMQLEARRVILENQRRAWDGEEPLPSSVTPNLPYVVQP